MALRTVLGSLAATPQIFGRIYVLFIVDNIFKKITTFFNLEDMFRCYEHHCQLHNV